MSDIDESRIALWRKNYAPDASDIEFHNFVEIIRRTGLSPEARQIYMTSRWDRKKEKNVYTILTGIDGYRLVADRTGKYAGNDDPVFDDERKPSKASVTVYKMVGNTRCPFTSSARWDQYYPGDAQGFMWKKMPHLMLGKCAEALALRKAFPAELSGLYTNEEMEQSGEVVEAAPAGGRKSAKQEAASLTKEFKQEDIQEDPQHNAVAQMLKEFAPFKVDKRHLEVYIGQRSKLSQPVPALNFTQEQFGWCRELFEAFKTKKVTIESFSAKLYGSKPAAAAVKATKAKQQDEFSMDEPPPHE